MMATYNGTPGNNTYVGTSGADWIDGAAGNDTLDGGSGNDTIYGGDGNDIIYGWENNDLIVGEAGNDSLYGENNADTIYGGAGDDWIVGDGVGDIGQDVMAGGPGADTLQGGADNDLYLFSFNSDGRDWIYDSSGDYDMIRVNGVTNISSLDFHRANYYSPTNDPNDLVIRRSSDPALSEYIVIDDYWNGSVAGAGRIEYLSVNGSNFWFNDVTWGM